MHYSIRLLFVGALVASAQAHAQNWPLRPVRVVVPFPAGGPADVLGRVMAARYTEALKQQFVIDNRPGANGNIGAALTAKAVNDGYTIMFATTGPLALNKLIIAMDLASAYIPHLKTGTVRPLAISTATRFSLLPDVPTVIEAGVSGHHAAGWFGVVGPAGMPQAAVAQLNKLANEWLASGEGANRLRDMGARLIGGAPADLGAFIRSELTKWQPVVEPIAAAMQ